MNTAITAATILQRLNKSSGGGDVDPFADIWGWWRADDFSGVTPNVILNDKSGNGRTMTQAAGTLTAGTAANGQARFTGNATARLTSSATIESWPVTIISIGRRTAAATCGFFGHTGATPFNTLWNGYESSDRFAIYNNSSNLNTTAEAGTDSCYVARIGYGSSESIVNGTILTNNALATIVRTAAITVSLGTEYRGLAVAWQETMVWNRVLTLAEIDAVYTYVNTRYSMSVPLYSSLTPVDTITLGGQSNAAGRGARGASDVNIPAEYDAALTGVNIWYGVPVGFIGTAFDTLNINSNNHMLGDTQAATYIGPELTYGKEYIDRVGGSIYFNKYALGGTFMHADAGDSHWDPFDNSLVHNSANRMFGQSMRNWWTSLRIHQAAGRRPVIKSRAFYQGEQDATVEAYANVWASLAAGFLDQEDAERGISADKTLIVRIHSGISIAAHPYRDTVRAQIESLVSTYPGAQLINVDDLGLSDGAHLDTPGYLTLGTRLADAT